MQPAAAHGLCILCLMADGAARAGRLRVLVQALGGSIGFLDALWANLVEDASAALTPMRLGGLPARAVILQRAGVGPGTILLATVAESAVVYPLVIAAGIGLALTSAPDWWREVAPRIARTAAGTGRWLIPALALSVLAGWLLWRFLPRPPEWLAPVRDWRQVRRAGLPALGGCMALSLASLAVRIAILPILTRTAASPPPLGAVTFSSFTLLYGQALLPTPSGAGAVELGFLSGGAGIAGAAATRLLLAWRFYTALVPIVAVIPLGMRLSASAVARLATRLRTPAPATLNRGDHT
jgi:uncharacterized membrane protein YbhN (UPF0104 family)